MDDVSTKNNVSRLLEHFIEHAEDEEAKEAKEILTSTHNKIVHYIERIKQIFEQEGAVVPVGFTEQDVNTEVPKLYDHLFDIMFLRLLKQMITGFAQAANEPEVRKYFIKGKELSKKIIANYTQLLLASDIQASSTWAGKATNSQIAPFSDKLMMYCTSIFCSFGLGSNALGTAFSLRNDLPLLLIDTAKDILTYGQEGGKIMARNGWMEEPPQMEDRIDLTK